MEEKITEIPYLQNIGFFLTYKCQVACPHCLVKAGPHRTEAMQEKDVLDWISQAAAYGDQVRSINFTGGEPFFDLSLFRKICSFSISKGLFPTSVTNAYWAETYERAVEVLESLPDLLFLQISADEHHQRCIPFERVENAVLAAQKLKLVCSVVVCTDNEESPGYKNIINQLLEIMDRKQINTVITFPFGRASLLTDRMLYHMTDTPPSGACGGAATPVIFPDGRVVSCMGPIFDIPGTHPLMLGNLFHTSLKEILDSTETNPVLHFIRTWGPSKIYTLMKERGYGPHFQDTFVEGDICILCRNLIINPLLRAGLLELFSDKDLVEAVAYGREYYLKEPEMVTRLGI